MRMVQCRRNGFPGSCKYVGTVSYRRTGIVPIWFSKGNGGTVVFRIVLRKERNVMFFELPITAANGVVIRIGAMDEDSLAVLETTARIHETAPPEKTEKENPCCRVKLCSARNPLPSGVPHEPVLTVPGVDIHRAGKDFYYRIAETPPPTWEESLRYRLPLLNAIMTATLEGRKLILFHGCLLLDDTGEGIILTGESEVGKSTTFRRWLAGGGQGMCDDLMLLSRIPSAADVRNGFFAQPLPTWSRCLREGIPAKDLRYPVNRKVPVRRILWLTRSTTGREELIPIPIQKWHGQLLAACNQHMLFSQHALTLEERKQLAMEYWKFVDEIDKFYSPLALAAHLEGNLRDTLNQLESYGRS